MNLSFYTGAVGAQQQQSRMNVHGNNISNVNTYGFKAEKSRFLSVMLATDTSLKAGGGVNTGYRYDYMINGEGYFALLDPADGQVSYTRNGAFQAAAFRPAGAAADAEDVMYLSDGEGRLVLDQEGELIPIPQAAGGSQEDPEQELPVGIFDFVNNNGMQHLSGTRFLPVQKNGGITAGTGELIRGMLEQSNVDLGEEFAKVIETQRAYSMALKMVQTSDEVENTVINLRS
ncbi:MAG: flagellar hook basal-body protein [Firmicutes bacterium]|nr:flagellar hook basal-body protein [Bacillota bacterium]